MKIKLFGYTFGKTEPDKGTNPNMNTYIENGLDNRPDDPTAPDPLLDTVLPKNAIPRVRRVEETVGQTPLNPTAIMQSAEVGAASPSAQAQSEIAAGGNNYSFRPANALVAGLDPTRPMFEEEMPILDIQPAATKASSLPTVPMGIDTSDRLEADGKVAITIRLAPELVRKLDEVVTITNTSRDDIMRKGIGIVDLAIKGRKQSLRVALADKNGMAQNFVDGLER